MDKTSLLNKYLGKINWSQKKSLYAQYFETYEILNTVLKPKISVIVISWKWNPLTLQNFKELQKQRDQNFELIFVDNGGKPGEFDELRPYVDKWVRLNENTGAYLARNVGAVFADAPVLLFLEDDGIPCEDFVYQHILIHERYKLFVVRGRVKQLSFEPVMEHKSYDLGENIKTIYCDTEGNCSFNANKYYSINGWDDKIRFGGGGLDISKRYFDKTPNYEEQIYNPNAIIYHDYVNSLEDYQLKKKKQEVGATYLRTKHPDLLHFFENYSSKNASALIPKSYISRKFKLLWRSKFLNEIRYMKKRLWTHWSQ